MATLIVLTGASCKKASEDKLRIEYEKYVMSNGLQVILHTDHSDPMMAYAIMYHTGSGREKPGKNGISST